jgi:hypothetical protein
MTSATCLSGHGVRNLRSGWLCARALRRARKASRIELSLASCTCGSGVGKRRERFRLKRWGLGRRKAAVDCRQLLMASHNANVNVAFGRINAVGRAAQNEFTVQLQVFYF